MGWARALPSISACHQVHSCVTPHLRVRIISSAVFGSRWISSRVHVPPSQDLGSGWYRAHSTWKSVPSRRMLCTVGIYRSAFVGGNGQ